MAPAAISASVTHSTAASSATSTKSSTSSSATSDAQFVMTSVFILLGLFLLVALCCIPLIVVTLRAMGTKGWSLRHYTQAKNSAHRRISTGSTFNYLVDEYFPTDAYSVKAGLSRMHSTPHSLLPHVPSYGTRFHPFSSFLNSPLFTPKTGFTIGQALIYLSYATYIIINLFLWSNPVTNASRSGFVAVSQMPVAVLLGCKNNFIGMLVGKGYEKLNYLHRWVGQFIFISTLFHVVYYLVKWTIAGTLSTSISTPVHVWGCVALAAVCLLAVVSLPFIRATFHTVFYHSHLIGFAILLIATSYHSPETLPYTLPSLAIYGLDLIIRVYQSHLVPANLTYLPDLQTTRITIPSLTSGWRAGQHVRIRVLGGMGRKGWSEVHPFTIASAGGGEGIELYVKAAGDWTTKLASFARASSASQGLPVAAKRRTMQLIKNLGSGRVVNVLVEGPYGGPGHTIISSYSAALVLCGGSGVSFGLGVVDEIVKDAEMGRARVRFAEMVWVTSDPVSVVPLLPTFTALLSRASKLLGLSLQITVYYTKAQPLDAFPSFALSPPPLFFAHEGDEDEKEASPEPTVREKAPPKAFELPPRLSVHPTRPSIEVHLNALINLTKSLKHGAGTHGLLIATCGTDGLSEGARKAESSIEGWVRKEIGGIEFFDEGFSC